MRSAKAETTDKGAEQATPDAQQHAPHDPTRAKPSKPPSPSPWEAALPSTSATTGATRTAGSLPTQLAMSYASSMRLALTSW